MASVLLGEGCTIRIEGLKNANSDPFFDVHSEKGYEERFYANTDLYPVFYGGYLDTYPGVTMELGFFRDACWADKRGIYRDCSLTSPQLHKVLENYIPPVDIIDNVRNLSTKYAQPENDIKWDKVVLICQNPTDYSLTYVSPGMFSFYQGYDRYMEWFIEMCETYGEQLYVKFHPIFSEAECIENTFANIAKRSGCSYGRANMSIIDTCEKVIMYNSSTAVDCWVRGVPFEYHASGTFANIPQQLGRQLVHFLMWKYCIPQSTTLDTWKDILTIYRDSGPYRLWPLPEDLSWGAWAVNNLLDKPLK